ncbi:MAG: NAD-dependent epimerase/dehydratase family protein [Eubacterium sp.]|nr:NAD-dependent epimerase/dehydratase family protein [Eubacterium sp.]MCM1216033.1 NAD-dependent epimerase/dehydratase family protein [Lachnospiraceae bacterium]MCM1304236.1 NAD-dependent epimerase/dehydratase family protein [Butyrivibrio sp.]MCM1344764.1 NAD-dependent epimerase/dehydratase family protein [Muribaculaceae bacterium]MCM1239857.1 NAD-dependent epimerase/dehydratase family protein [Lachnospiraceae bacterium]
MKLLVIGGSYFFGRVFVTLTAKVHDITVVNRGTYSLEEMGVKQIRGDRHDPALWQGLRGDYDAVVDFCAYDRGDISLFFENFRGHIRQYILISTVDVYQRTGGVKGEDSPFENRIFPGEAGAYIAGKVALEQELPEVCTDRGVQYSVLRPAVLYGPYDYAPRESEYIRFMVQQGLLPHITDTTGRFQLVYVKDAAEAVQRCLLNERTYGQAYNLCQDEIMDYDRFYHYLSGAADVEVREVPLTCAQALEQGVPLPFPLTEEETLLVSNEKSRAELGLVYTDPGEGMAKTYRAFKGVYGS